MEELNEANLKRIMTHAQDKDFCIISASRASINAQDKSEKEKCIDLQKQQEINNKNTDNLEHDIWGFSYNYIKLKGFYTEYEGTPFETKVEENSFFVFNTNKTVSSAEFKYNMLQLAKLYNQECIILGTRAPKKIVLITADGEELKTFTSITRDILDKVYSRVRHTDFKFMESDHSKEERNRSTQTFGTVAYRIMLREKLVRMFPELEKFRDKSKF